MTLIGTIVIILITSWVLESFARNLREMRGKIENIDDRTSRTIDKVNDARYVIDEINERTTRITAQIIDKIK